MTPRVRLQVTQLGKCLLTARMSAPEKLQTIRRSIADDLENVCFSLLVRFVTGMSSNMLLEVGKLRELPLADLATVWFDP